jgi:hypothetical protein
VAPGSELRVLFLCFCDNNFCTSCNFRSTGKGNNLHDSGIFLVSMAKKYRQTIWLKKGDCLVIDPIAEGKKVLGEIFCVIPVKSVLELVESGKWPLTNMQLERGDGEENGCQKAKLLEFFSEPGGRNLESPSAGGRNDNGMDLPPTSSSEDEEEDEDEEVDSGEEGPIETLRRSSADLAEEAGQGTSPTSTSEGFKSRVDFVTSGIVTVTNVTMDVTRLENGLQSLDFETEDSSEESSIPIATSNKDLHK